MYDLRIKFQSGFVAVVGCPNVGKSTLINSFLKQKIACVSFLPQTTRKRQLGILTMKNSQIIFIDTPGILQPRNKLDQRMIIDVRKALDDCDIILFMVDINNPPGTSDQYIIDHIRSATHEKPIIFVMNKIDKIEKSKLQKHYRKYQELMPHATSVEISALTGEGLDHLIKKIHEHLPFSPPYYSSQQVTDMYERDLAAEFIREACLNLLREEIPYGIAVRIDQYVEPNEGNGYIEATIFVERESHKGMVIGQSGRMLKKIGSKARMEIEAMCDHRIYLRLNVKVWKNWRQDKKMLNWLGY